MSHVWEYHARWCANGGAILERTPIWAIIWLVRHEALNTCEHERYQVSSDASKRHVQDSYESTTQPWWRGNNRIKAACSPHRGPPRRRSLAYLTMAWTNLFVLIKRYTVPASRENTKTMPLCNEWYLPCGKNAVGGLHEGFLPSTCHERYSQPISR